MAIHPIEHTMLQAMLREQFHVEPDGFERYVVETPFTYGDGDGLAVILKRLNDEWIITDEGETLMHLSYRLDVDTLIEPGMHSEMFSSILTSHDMALDNGELVLKLPVNGDYGARITSFIEALLQITDRFYVTRRSA